jgi:hypothetical protein
VGIGVVVNVDVEFPDLALTDLLWANSDTFSWITDGDPEVVGVGPTSVTPNEITLRIINTGGLATPAGPNNLSVNIWRVRNP